MKRPNYGDARITTKLCIINRVCGKWYFFKILIVKEEYQKDAYLDVSNYTDEIEGYVDGWVVTSVLKA